MAMAVSFPLSLSILDCRLLNHHTIFAAELYNAIYALVLSRSDISELTVEDPAEAFEDLRDRNDLKMLLSNSQFIEEGFGNSGIGVSHGGGRVVKGNSRKVGTTAGNKVKAKMGPPAEKGWVERWRKDLKIAGVSYQPLLVSFPLLCL